VFGVGQEVTAQGDRLHQWFHGQEADRRLDPPQSWQSPANPTRVMAKNLQVLIAVRAGALQQHCIGALGGIIEQFVVQIFTVFGLAPPFRISAHRSFSPL
jgi:hypothetical protein